MILLTALTLLSLQAAPQSPAGDAARAAATAATESLFDDQEPSPHDDPPIVCVRDGNTLEMNTCAMEDLEAEQARMARYLALARQRAAKTDAESGRYGAQTRQVELLNTAQKAWEAYADVRCEARWDEVQGGTIRALVLLSCQIDETRKRTHDIWADHLTYWDSTPPVLPEPTQTVWEEQAADGAR
ncbi:lysozyme inhibitor LprI family protein [Brevundimonas sp. FT23042]|uniref:lysozyme inhibitor LprI family protein n=1 Tax=Brevundimonas sp. FT23042 TaxID=3393749 RepID=UPI003B588D5F